MFLSVIEQDGICSLQHRLSALVKDRESHTIEEATCKLEPLIVCKGPHPEHSVVSVVDEIASEVTRSIPSGTLSVHQVASKDFPIRSKRHVSNSQGTNFSSTNRLVLITDHSPSFRELSFMYHVVICTKEYQAPFETKTAVIFKKGEVYQAEDHGEEYRVWRSYSSFLKFSPTRFQQFFMIFC